MEEFAGALQSLEIWMHYRKGKGIHTVQFGVGCRSGIIPQEFVRLFSVAPDNKD